MDHSLYLQMWLSEQIPIKDWLKILDTFPSIEREYKEHIDKVGIKDERLIRVN